MKQYDLDAMEMRITRICAYMTETASMIRIFLEIHENQGAYFFRRIDISSLAYLIAKYVSRVQRDIVQLKNDIEFPVSNRHS